MPTALAPEELEAVVPEEEANSLQVLANVHHIEILRIIHLADQYWAAENIQETCVKLFKNRAEFANSKPTDAKPNWPLELSHCIGIVLSLREC